METTVTPAEHKRLRQSIAFTNFQGQSQKALYTNYLNTGLVWYLIGRFVSGCQKVQDLNGGLKTGLKKAC